MDDDCNYLYLFLLYPFLGDVVGVVFEEMLKERGDQIANNIRTKIGDIATLVINKSNVALEMTFKNLQKLLYTTLLKRRF